MPKKSKKQSKAKKTNAALIIQRTWRLSWRHKATKAYAMTALHFLDTEQLTHLSFSNLIKRCRNKIVLAVTERCLTRIHFLCSTCHPFRLSRVSNARLLLGGYIIAMQPSFTFAHVQTAVLNSANTTVKALEQLERAVLESARTTIKALEQLLEAIVKAGAFSAVPDETSRDFLPTLQDYLDKFRAWKTLDEETVGCNIKNALVDLYQSTIDPNDPDCLKKTQETEACVTRLRKKLKELYSPGTLEQFDIDLKNGKTFFRIEAKPEPVVPIVNHEISKEQMCQELLMDPSFQLDTSHDSPIKHSICQTPSQGYWDELVEQLDLPFAFHGHLLSVFSMIETRLSHVHSGTKKAMNLSRLKKEDFQWSSCTRVVGEVVAIILDTQQPEREAEMREQWRNIGRSMLDEPNNSKVLCSALQFLLDRANLLLLDKVNTTLRHLAPSVKEHGVDYVQSNFKNALSAGTIALTHTKAWLQQAARSGVAKEAVHTKAMVTLVAQPIMMETFPETLQLDVYRLRCFQKSMDRIVDSITVLTVMTQTAGTKVDIDAQLTGINFDIEMLFANIGPKLDSMQLLMKRSDRIKFFNMLSKCVTNKNHPVRRLM